MTNQNHHDAETARELKQDFPAALAAIDAALIDYAEDGDVYGIAESLCSRVLTLRHLADKTGQDAFVTAAHHDAMAAVEITEKAGVSTAIPYLNLGKVQKALGNIEKAIESFTKAIDSQESQPHETQNRPAVLANMKEILATTQLQAGDESALDRATAALEELEGAEENEYNKAVWMSHGYGRIAASLKDSQPEKAREYYEKAKAIIEGNADLTLSKGKLAQLQALFEE